MDEQRADGMELANEFALVRVRRVFTRNGERLEIFSPRLGRSVRLDPLELESLTWQTEETFTGFLAEPFGPPDGARRAPARGAGAGS